MKNKKEIANSPYITGILMCCILYSVTLFVFSYRFVNAEVTPKWLGLMLTVGSMGIVWSVLYRKDRKGTFLIKSNDAVVLFGTIIAFATALSIQGIFQYIGVLSSGNSNFAITGSFDNPAGFASALACALPLCFLFFKTIENQKSKIENWLKYAAMGAASLMALVILLTGSRAGILAIAVATTFWLLLTSKKLRVTPRLLRVTPRNNTETVTQNISKNPQIKQIKIAIIIVLFLLPAALYFFKRDSADGRLLIWRTTFDMVADKPIIGHGYGAFQAKYMLYQAAYFEKNPDSRYAPLADNVLHPFNEYMLALAQYGIVGLGVIALIGFLLIRAYRRDPTEEKLTALMCLLAIAVFSFFSYPFRYPFTWFMLFLCMAVILAKRNTLNTRDTKDFHKGHNGFVSRICALGGFFVPSVIKKQTVARLFVFLISTGLLAHTVMLTRAEIVWKRIARQSLAGQTEKVLPEYDKLYRWLGKDGLFLYNHAAELHVAKQYEKSIAVFERCTRYFNDMDVQMLLAANYKELGRYAEAEQHLKMAAAMCPARFMPLYDLVNLYNASDRKEEAFALAQIIIDKDVKIPSHTVTAIKNEMRRLIEAKETSTRPENDNRTSDEPENDDTRQGETPEQGEALPP